MKRFMLAVLLALTLIPSPIRADSLDPHAEQILHSVVHLVGTMRDEETGADDKFGCSAFSVAPRKLMTAAHCVPEGMTSLLADNVPAFPIKVDRKHDLAILLWDRDVAPLSFRDAPLQRFEWVQGFGYGYSWRHPMVTDNKVIILNYTPDETIMCAGTWFIGPFIGGMSGGPIVDAGGLVVGVVQRSSSAIAYGVSVETINEFIAAQ